VISFLRGQLIYSSLNYLVMDVNGVGYKAHTPASVYYDLPKLGEEIKIHTYLHVREDIMQLYGFLNSNDLELFELLINVSGIGPKAGLSILSSIKPDKFKAAINAEDLIILTKIPGIGKKTAQRMVLELKDKLTLDPAQETTTDNYFSLESETIQNALEALLALGYHRTEAKRAIDGVTGKQANSTVEILIKESLKLLAKG